MPSKAGKGSGNCRRTWPSLSRNQAAAESQPLEYSLQRLKVLWLAVPLFIVWTNSHGGFLAGLCIFIAYLGLRGFEAICRKGRQADGLIIRFSLMAAAAIAATFINPYGHNFHLWLYDDLKVPRPEIVEWRARSFLIHSSCRSGCCWRQPVQPSPSAAASRDFTHVTILGLVLWQALTHHRHIAFFAIACGWWLPLHWDSLLARSRRRVSNPRAEPYAATFTLDCSGLSVCCSIFAICVCSGQLAYRLTTLKVERENYPVSHLNSSPASN